MTNAETPRQFAIVQEPNSQKKKKDYGLKRRTAIHVDMQVGLEHTRCVTIPVVRRLPRSVGSHPTTPQKASAKPSTNTALTMDRPMAYTTPIVPPTSPEGNGSEQVTVTLAFTCFAFRAWTATRKLDRGRQNARVFDSGLVAQRSSKRPGALRLILDSVK
jgi:hypothetical protein